MENELPQYRATLCKTILSLVRAHAKGEAILTQGSSESIQIFDEANRLAWLPCTPFDEFNKVIYAVLGEEEFVNFWRSYAKNATQVPLFGPLVKGALSIFGSNPAPMLKQIARGWALTTRNYGRVMFDIDKAEKRFRAAIVDLPPPIRLPTVALTMKGSILGTIELGRCTGEVIMDAHELSDGRVKYEGTWTASE